jgi:hypothetical protein
MFKVGAVTAALARVILVVARAQEYLGADAPAALSLLELYRALADYAETSNRAIQVSNRFEAIHCDCVEARVSTLLTRNAEGTSAVVVRPLPAASPAPRLADGRWWRGCDRVTRPCSSCRRRQTCCFSCCLPTVGRASWVIINSPTYCKPPYQHHSLRGG